jgi:hypothetical protein
MEMARGYLEYERVNWVDLRPWCASIGSYCPTQSNTGLEWATGPTLRCAKDGAAGKFSVQWAAFGEP